MYITQATRSVSTLVRVATIELTLDEVRQLESLLGAAAWVPQSKIETLRNNILRELKEVV